MAKAAASGADALIIDLEDSVAPERKDAGRAAIAAWLADRKAPTFARVNLVDSGLIADDLGAVLAGAGVGVGW